jgi:hypothetical protein
MSQVTRQTVTLGASRHESPVEAACVMEFTSMPRAEPLTDRPRTIAAFLRVYNDPLDGERRRYLYS